MSNGGFGWESLLHTDAPSACHLKGALLTTYDRADERLLAEHLLPFVLKLGREPESEGVERQYFLIELDHRLKQLHDRIVVVSSTAREEPRDAGEVESGAYGWVWRSVRHLTVGSRGKAVQHAKFWLFHWGADDGAGDEYLELVVSSANLTRAACRGQLQAVWRACIKLYPQRSTARLARWGVLPEFLRELFESADEATRFSTYAELLARADCPDGVTFVASVPGRHARPLLRRTPWGVAGLREVIPWGTRDVGISILSPFIGSWDAESLTKWCATYGGRPDRIELVWIDGNHPWARTERWLMPEAALKALSELDVTLLRLRHEPGRPEGTDLFHEEHRPADERWSHAKLYSIRRGAARRLLVTSANFSPAAWGRESRDGTLTIENFELGVCVEESAWPFTDLPAFDDLQDVASVSSLPSRGSACITWARAVWDGTGVAVDCRCDCDAELTGELDSCGERTPITSWGAGTDLGLYTARVAWTDSTRPPSFVRLCCDQELVDVNVFDERPPQDRESSLPPGVDEDIAQTMRDALIFELYGGQVAAEAAGEVSPEAEDEDGGDEEAGGGGRPDSYSVPAFALARRHLAVVDNWAGKVKLAAVDGTAGMEPRVLRRDGELLVEAFRRQAERDDKKGPGWAIGAKLAAEELAVRLAHFAET